MIGDQIPVDLVVNTIIAAAAYLAMEWEQGKRRKDILILHSSTSTSNPVPWRTTAEAVVKYWRHCPSAKSQVYCRYRMVSNPVAYRVSHLTQVTVPALALGMYAGVSRDPKVQKKAKTLKKVLERTRLLTETFYHFVNNEWFFDNSNTEHIESLMTEADRSMFACTAKGLNWRNYITDFQYGLQRWVLKDEVVRPSHSVDVLKRYARIAIHFVSFVLFAPGTYIFVYIYTHIHTQTHTYIHTYSHVALCRCAQKVRASPCSLCPSFLLLQARIYMYIYIHTQRIHTYILTYIHTNSIEGRGRGGVFGGWFLSDVLFALRFRLASPGLYKTPSPSVMRQAVMSNKAVMDVAGQTPEGRAKVSKMIDKLGAKMSLPTVRFMGWLMRKLFRGLFDAVAVDRAEMDALADLPETAAVIIAPTHKSYMDFVLVSWVLFAANLKTPHIAAGEDFLNLVIVTWLFRNSGAFFIPRTVEDPLWAAIVSAYLQELLRHNQWVEFFVEGARSRTGKVMPPRLGLITTVVEALASKAASEIYIVPAAVSYEGCLEVSSHVRELMGDKKTKESVNALVRAAPGSLSARLGSVHVSFSAPLKLSEFLAAEPTVAQGDEAARSRVAQNVANKIGEGMVSSLRATTVSIVAGILLRYGTAGVAMSQLRREVGALRRELGDRGVLFINPSSVEKVRNMMVFLLVMHVYMYLCMYVVCVCVCM
jgi:1-acyl-sn-glycerol-3-phosphate acyltransferase